MTDELIRGPFWFISAGLAGLTVATLFELLTIHLQLRKASQTLTALPGGIWGGIGYAVVEAAFLMVPIAAFLALYLEHSGIFGLSGWTFYVAALLGWPILSILGKWALRNVSPWFMRVSEAVNALPLPL